MSGSTKSLIVANDIVGLGKVALSSALPILACCQIEVTPLPTVLLSSHTGGFEQISLTDLTDQVAAFLRQWQGLSVSFDGLVTGYIRSVEQLAHLTQLTANSLIPRFIDPVMGDRGQLYTGFDETFVEAMKVFCQGAAVLIPNMTEAAFLTDTPFLNSGYDEGDIVSLLHRLGDFGCDHILLTGVSFSPDKIGVAYFDKRQNKVTYYLSHAFSEHFFGTGDLLTAVLAAGYFHNLPFEATIPLALDFLHHSLAHTLSLKRDLRYGICYEPFLASLAQNMITLKEKIDETD